MPNTRRHREQQAEIIGEGIIDTMSNFAKTIVYGRTEYPTVQQNIIGKYKDNQVKSIRIGRTPVPSLVQSAINAVSLGAFAKKFKTMPYDTLYHLFVLVWLDNNTTILLEKNEAINMVVNPPQPPKTTTYMDVSGITGLTFGTMLENTKNKMGDKYFPYSGTTNNCQDFILNIFSANQKLTPSIQDFVKQDVSKLFENLKFRI